MGSIPTTSTTSQHCAVCERFHLCNRYALNAGCSFSQKSFAMQNLFGSPGRLWCPRCVFHTPKSTTSQHCAVCERLHLCNRYAFNAGCSFSQKSFATQNIFGSPDRLWCPRCVFHTPKSTIKCGQKRSIHLNPGIFLGF